MPIDPDDVKPGHVYITKKQQLRFVTQVVDGKVNYMAKSGKPNQIKRSWGWPATKAKPPEVDTFAKAVESEVYLKI